MAGSPRPKRMKKMRMVREYISGDDCDAILGLVDPEPARESYHRPRTVFPAVCLTASRVRGPAGDVLFEQHVSDVDVQAFRAPDEAAGERIEYFVQFKDGEVAPSWEPAENVGAALISQYKHLLHSFPLIERVNFSEIELGLLKTLAVRALVASVSEALKEKLSKVAFARPNVTATLKVDLPVFLALFGHTKGYAGETAMSLVAHKATSRNVAFAEVNELLGAVCGTWHTRTHRAGHSTRVIQDAPVRVSLRLINSTDFDHSACPRCHYPSDQPLLGRPVHASVQKHLFTAWEMRLTLRYVRD